MACAVLSARLGEVTVSIGADQATFDRGAGFSTNRT